MEKESNSPIFIKDAIVWCQTHWLRGSDFSITGMDEDGSPTYSTPYSLGIQAVYHNVYPYESWMSEYIGTDKDIRLDPRFDSEGNTQAVSVKRHIPKEAIEGDSYYAVAIRDELTSEVGYLAYCLQIPMIGYNKLSFTNDYREAKKYATRNDAVEDIVNAGREIKNMTPESQDWSMFTVEIKTTVSEV